MPLKIIFFGSDYYSSLVLKQLILSPLLRLTATISSREPTLPFEYDSVSEISKNLNIASFSIDEDEPLNEIKGEIEAMRPDIGIIASFGYKIPKSIINIPNLNIYNLHPSLLPQYRGPAPAGQAIIEGRNQTGITIMQINEEFDQGQVIKQQQFYIYPDDTNLTLLKRLFTEGIAIFLQLIKEHPSGNFPSHDQNHQGASYSQRLTQKSGEISWLKPDQQIQRQVRAHYPKPICWTTLAKLAKRFNKTPNPRWQHTRAKIYSIRFKNQTLYPEILQISGKKAISWEQFDKGYL